VIFEVSDVEAGIIGYSAQRFVLKFSMVPELRKGSEDWF